MVSPVSVLPQSAHSVVLSVIVSLSHFAHHLDHSWRDRIKTVVVVTFIFVVTFAKMFVFVKYILIYIEHYV